MQKLIIATLGASIALGAANAYAIPASSPYALAEPQAIDGAMQNRQGSMVEGRAGFVDDSATMRRGPTWEESTAYSHGK
jgi:hypothetical protein